MYSMTGYGKSDYRKKKLSISIEMFSVNSRYLEFMFRTPKQLSFLEPKLKELISSKINRGKITTFVNYADYGTGLDQLVVNEVLADEIHSKLISLKKKYKLDGEVNLSHFLNFPEIFNVEKSANIEEIVWPIVKVAVERALKDLVKMRGAEGDNLKKDLAGRSRNLEKWINRIDKLAPQNVELYRDKLNKRIEEVMNDNTMNGKRFEEEVAYMADKADITEECVRFKSHLKQFNSAIKNSGSAGKKLNFILQEFNRETNTIGAKAGGTEIPRIVLDLKEEIEKMREQVQNIE